MNIHWTEKNKNLDCVWYSRWYIHVLIRCHTGLMNIQGYAKNDEKLKMVSKAFEFILNMYGNWSYLKKNALINSTSNPVRRHSLFLFCLRYSLKSFLLSAHVFSSRLKSNHKGILYLTNLSCLLKDVVFCCDINKSETKHCKWFFRDLRSLPPLTFYKSRTLPERLICQSADSAPCVLTHPE